MPGTYVGLKLTSESSSKLAKYIKGCKLKGSIPVNKLHCTLYYANEKPIEGYSPDPKKIYESYVIGYDFMGKGEWSALVLKIFSPEMMKQHKRISTYGSPHSHPGFIPHISLKYGPVPGDILHLKDNCPLGMVLNFTGEYKEPIKE